MKLIRLLQYVLVLSALTAFGQQKAGPVFRFENRITAGSDSPQIHALWEGMKNPLIITCSDPKIKYSIHAKGGTILNEGIDHSFDLIPHQRDIQLVAIAANNDTLYAATLICRKMIAPTFELLSGTKPINDNSTINKNTISLLSVNVLANAILKRDIIELPKYNIDKIEINLLRSNTTVLSVNSFSSINSIKMNAKSGDILTIVISSYSYIDGLGNSIPNKNSRVFQLKVI